MKYLLYLEYIYIKVYKEGGSLCSYFLLIMCPLNLKGAGQISSFNDSFILTTQFLPDSVFFFSFFDNWVHFKLRQLVLVIITLTNPRNAFSLQDLNYLLMVFKPGINVSQNFVLFYIYLLLLIFLFVCLCNRLDFRYSI